MLLMWTITMELVYNIEMLDDGMTHVIIYFAITDLPLNRSFCVRFIRGRLLTHIFFLHQVDTLLS